MPIKQIVHFKLANGKNEDFSLWNNAIKSSLNGIIKRRDESIDSREFAYQNVVSLQLVDSGLEGFLVEAIVTNTRDAWKKRLGNDLAKYPLMQNHLVKSEKGIKLLRSEETTEGRCIRRRFR